MALIFILGKNEEILLNNRNIALECCLTSNVLCGSVPSYSDHHFLRFYQNNHPVVICVGVSSIYTNKIIHLITLLISDEYTISFLQTDDFGVFSTSLTKELQIVLDTFNLSCEDLIELSRMAINVSFAFDDEKQLIYDRIDDFTKKISQTM